MFPLVHLAADDGLTILTLDRPPVNAIDIAMAEAIRDAVETSVAAQPTALIVSGKGDAFCGGLDLKVVPTYSPLQLRSLERVLGEMVLAFYSAPIPVIAAINGHAVAAGTLICLCADYRVAPDRDCRFGLTGARVDIPYPESAMAVIRTELSPAAARRMTLTARTFDQHFALENGIVDELVPANNVMTRARAVAQDMASLPRNAFAKVKQQLRQEATAAIADAVNRAGREESGVWIADPSTPDASKDETRHA